VPASGSHHLDANSFESSPVDPTAREGVLVTDTFLHIFTSGTTGLPKAARIHHMKFLLGGPIMFRFMRVKPTDRFFVSLPLYHSSALLIGVQGCIEGGIPCILSRKFSARTFFIECCASNATVMLYIGELCRYLCAAPAGPHDRQHALRLAIGNGMRPDVWATFQERFGIAEIGEFYASTEGNANLVNNQNRLGAIGFISPLIAVKYPVRIVKFDVANDDLVRTADGRCIEAGVDEPGELIGQIDHRDVSRRFEGYSDKKETDKKIICNVLQPGDFYFRTGDLVKKDAEGFIYFVDRIGDTFRWKGENVSTAEVAEVVGSVPGGGILEVAVYGVAVPLTEGRAGAAALVVDGAFSLDKLYQHCSTNLPKFALPNFLRIKKQLECTGTFKMRKVELVNEGFDPKTISEPLFFRDDRCQAFVPLDNALYGQIVSGQVKL